MSTLACPGLPAWWLNGWLAAVGTTVLVPQMQLSWTDDPSPHAVLRLDGAADPVDAIAGAWPSDERIAAMPIARNWHDAGDLKRKPPLSTFTSRARASRGHPDSWALSSTVTDLFVTDRDPAKAAVAHARLDPPAPKGVTLHDRLLSLADAVTDTSVQAQRSFEGRGERVRNNGLGFDVTRLTALADSSHNRVDPIIEMLAFFGLALLPVRGSGVTDGDPGVREATAVRARCWHRLGDERSLRMCWPAWSAPLRRDAIDALLDAWQPSSRPTWHPLSVHAGWRSVEYKGRGQSDSTKGIGSEAL